jgi:hypothetical protein
MKEEYMLVMVTAPVVVHIVVYICQLPVPPAGTGATTPPPPETATHIASLATFVPHVSLPVVQHICP